MLIVALGTNAQTLTEVFVPKHFAARTAASANNARMPVIFCFQITGLTPNTQYDLRVGLALSTEASTSYGAGNQWNGVSLGTANYLKAFTTDASGNTGYVWGVIQPTGNSTGGRFAPGTAHTIRYGIVAAGGSMPASATFAGTKQLIGLDLGNSALTAGTTDDGAWILGSANSPSHGKVVMAYDNTAGTGDPIAIGFVENHPFVQGSNSDLPTAVNGVLQGTAVNPGDYVLLVPIGANNANGIRRIETRDTANINILFSETDADGVWPSGANTTTIARRDVVSITNTDAPLPVSYKSFAASRANNETVLRWSTASETNNSHFEVQRSVDGKNFTSIAEVRGKGTTNKTQSYSYVDADVLKAKTVYYRLKQVDFDGQFEYSKTVSIANTTEKAGISATTPNPFNSELNVFVNAATAGTAQVEVLDMIGKSHFSNTQSLTVGNNKVEINTADMPMGIYFVRVQLNGETFTQKVIKK